MSANSSAFDHVNGFRWRQGDPFLAESEARLYDLGVLRSVLEESVEIAVADARADGVTWAKIGDALGVTHQAVIKRYSKGGAR
ncbi:helix-turn-helix domain-containing protein [Timonella senegalensis]|uniref:helix-turn-helix domain-containing protein n=1 Tax=Timonella senegalensis TaxID=1465825 RepID=UPI0028AA5CD0|nr:helix-turn-helix domain-containing protein [Timonella senegalensis]